MNDDRGMTGEGDVHGDWSDRRFSVTPDSLFSFPTGMARICQLTWVREGAGYI